MRLTRLGFTIRRMMLIVALTALVLSYFGSYYRLSRRGMHEAAELKLAGFLYVPFKEAAEREDLTRHYALMALYAPLNWLDRAVFGTPGPTTCIMRRLSGDTGHKLYQPNRGSANQRRVIYSWLGQPRSVSDGLPQA